MDKKLSADLEGVRGVSAFAVLVAHVIQWFVGPLLGREHWVMHGSAVVAHFAVLVFFVLSGYVIADSLVSNYQRNGRIDGMAYIVSRLARILPPWAVSLAFALIVAYGIRFLGMHGAESFRTDADLYVAREYVSVNPRSIFATLLLSNGIIPGMGTFGINSPLWSLSIEFWLYFIGLLVAVLVASVHIGKFKDHGYLALVGLVMVSLLLMTNFDGFVQYMLYWLVGAAVLLGTKFRQFHGFLVCGLIVLLGIGGGAVAFLEYSKADYTLHDGGVVAFVKLGVIVLGLGLFVLTRKVGLPYAWFRVLAKSSYTLYVLHFPVLLLAFSIFHREYMTWDRGWQVVFMGFLTAFIFALCHILARFLENKKVWQERFAGFFATTERRIASVFQGIQHKDDL